METLAQREKRLARSGGWTLAKSKKSAAGKCAEFIMYGTANEYPKTSASLPKWCDGADHVKDGRQAGKPIITSRQHERELCRQYGYTREYDS